MRVSWLILVAGFLGAAAIGCGGGSSEPVEPFTLQKAGVPAQIGSAGAVLADAPVFLVLDAEGMPVPGVTVTLAVELGGGSVDPAQITTDMDGKGIATWTLGLPPVVNRLRGTIGAGTVDESSTTFDVMGELVEPVVPQFFGDIHGFMSSAGIEGSTEDLAFTGDGGLLLGVKGGLLDVDSAAEAAVVELTGDEIGNSLGIAVDAAGNVWVADSGDKALRKVDGAGVVETALTGDGLRDLEGPNYVALGPDGHVYLSDPCLGEIIRYDPVQKKIVALLSFSLKTEGGPNGMAFDATGENLYVLTENTGVLCGHDDVDMKAPIAGLFSVAVTADGFGAREVLEAGIGLFGDGLAFDAEGNLYVIVDRLLEGALALDDSAIWVLPADGEELLKFASLEDPLEDGILANVAFGRGDFGETTLYIALLSMPPFSPADKRGLMKVEVGIPGQPLFE